MGISVLLPPACSFLYLNGYALDQTDDQIYEAFIGLATKDLSQADFFAWVARYVGTER